MLDCREVRTDFNCDSCYELTADYCSDIIVSAGLVPIASYFLQLFDQFDIRRTIEFETDINGGFTIDQSLLPGNYFNPFGAYDFCVSTDEDGETISLLTFSSVEYRCVVLFIERVVGNDYVDSDYVESDYIE